MTTISEIIDNRPLSSLQIRTMILCGLVTLIDGYDMQAFGLAIPAISKAWGLTSADFSMPVLAFMIGLGFGSALISPLGDRLGRRPIIVFGLLLVGATSLAAAHAGSINELTIWRALTGAGIGICQANATALTAEFAPIKRRAGLMTAMGLFVGVGAMIAAMTSGSLMKAHGWPVLFNIGGYLPLVIAVAFALLASESPRLLFARNFTIASHPRLAKILRQLAPDIDATTIVADPAEVSRTPTMIEALMAVVRKPYLERTLYLWALFACTSLLLYTLINWLPALLASSGWKDPGKGMMTMQLGGIVGSLILAWAIDRGHLIASLTCGYLLAGISALLFLFLPAQGPSWFALAAGMGMGISGGMLAVAALGAIFYPPAIRATGFGWAAAAARVGAVSGPLVVGLLMQGPTPPSHIIAWLSVPALICGLIVISMRGVMKRL